MTRKKLIEVALPLDVINKESLRRKAKAPKGWPTSFHKWWAQRPLAAARAVIFAQMVDDPSSLPDLFPSQKAQDNERQRLFRLIGDLIQWQNTDDDEVARAAMDEIRLAWRRICTDHAGESDDRFDPDRLPAFLDPFAGGGCLPISAQWLGLDCHASDLNPVAVVINKGLLEIPTRFAGTPPVNPAAAGDRSLVDRTWDAARGLAEDVRFYGERMASVAAEEIGRLYPEVRVTPTMVQDRPDLRAYEGENLKVVAWIWARTVISPNPAFSAVRIPLASTFMLSTKKGREAFVEPVLVDGGYEFRVRMGTPADPERTKRGTTAGKRSAFECVMSGAPVTYEYIRAEGKAGRIGARLMAIVAEGARGRVYLSPTPEHESVASLAIPRWRPDLILPDNPRDFKTPNYGLTLFSDLFTERQLTSLATLSDLVAATAEIVRGDALSRGMADDSVPLRDGGQGAKAYAEAVGVYLACVIDRVAYYGSSLVGWLPKDGALGPSMPRQAVQMTWDFAEANPFGKSSGDIQACVRVIASCLEAVQPRAAATVRQADARTLAFQIGPCIVSTDPPYFDNIAYADLSDFFYVWLRSSLRDVFPELFSTLAVPKSAELIASPERHGGGDGARTFFLHGMTDALAALAARSVDDYPITIYYAFKQSETTDDAGTASTGWESFLEAVIASGLTVTGTWPLRTEGSSRMMASGTNALASSIVLACRKQSSVAPIATRLEFLAALRDELPSALGQLQSENVAPVDLAQAAIGPGMAIFTRFSRVLGARDEVLSVKEALAAINEILDEVLADQDGDFDSDSRFGLTWFEEFGFDEGDFGRADGLARARNTSVAGLVAAGFATSARSKFRLLRPEELQEAWSPSTDARLTVWDMVHHLIRILSLEGEVAAAHVVKELGSNAEAARELCYRLYTICERKKRSREAAAYNQLVVAWPELLRLGGTAGLQEQMEV